MAKKRRKKGKGGGKQATLNLSIALEAYKNENYPYVLNLLKKAKILPDQVGIVKQLKTAINQQLALNHFVKYELTTTIKQLKPNFHIEARKGFPLATYQSKLLAGLTHLYLGNFKEAATTLANCKVQESTQRFCMYYLLAELYQQKYTTTNFVDFEKKYQTDIAHLNSNQYQYVCFVFYLQQLNYPLALEALKKISPQNKFEENNINALIGIFLIKETPNAIAEFKPSKVLYKVFFKQSLTIHEKQYLNKFKAFETYLKEKEKAYLNVDIEHLLKKMCEQGVVLEDVELAQCLDNTQLQAFQSHILYNQFANLLNDGIEKQEKRISQLISKYWRYIFRIPESIFLYLQFVESKERGESPSIFFHVVDYYIDTFEDALNDRQLQFIGWEIFLITGRDLKIRKALLSRRKIWELTERFPTLLPFKLWFWIQDRSDKKIPMPDMALDLFSYEHSEIEEERIISNVAGFFGTLFFEDDEEMMELYKNEIASDYAKNITFVIKTLLAAIEKHKVHPKAKTILGVFNVLKMNIYKCDKMFGPKWIEDTLKEKVDQAYKKQLQDLGEFYQESPYYISYQTNHYLKRLEAITPILERSGNKTTTKKERALLKKTYKDAIGVGLSEIVINLVAEGIKKRVFTFAKPTMPLTELIDTYATHFPDMAEVAAVGIADELLNKGEFSFVSFKFFLVKLLKELPSNFKKQKYEEILMHLYREIALDDLAETQLEPLYYNLAGRSLVMLEKMVKRNPNFNYERELIKTLIITLEKTVATKKLKRLGKICQNARTFFIENTNHEL